MRTLLALLLFAYGSAVAAESYLCVGVASAGVSFKDGSWNSKRFNVKGDKYIVNIDAEAMEVTRVGSSRPEYACPPLVTVRGVFSCPGAGFPELDRFVFNKKHLRFAQAYTGTYVFGDSKFKDAGVVTIGTCSPITSTQPDAALLRNIQSALAAKGYNPGPADGKTGDKTRTAIKKFQRSIGLPASGKATPELLMLLKAQ